MRVEVVPYDPSWPNLFRELAIRLRNELGETACRIDHIGSTAVPGLDAKPIIDAQISVSELEPVHAYGDGLVRLGFVHRADNPDKTKRYFREASGQRRTHIHVRRAGSWSEQFALLFRDYLRAHEAEAQRYAEVKHILAGQYGDDREGYTEAKSPFIWQLMRSAGRWSQEVGWQPGPSDA